MPLNFNILFNKYIFYMFFFPFLMDSTNLDGMLCYLIDLNSMVFKTRTKWKNIKVLLSNSITSTCDVVFKTVTKLEESILSRLIEVSSSFIFLCITMLFNSERLASVSCQCKKSWVAASRLNWSCQFLAIILSFNRSMASFMSSMHSFYCSLPVFFQSIYSLIFE